MPKTAYELERELTAQVSRVVVGKSTQLRLITAAILAEGHILLEDLPGVGKTTLVKCLARALGCESKRIQFTPDLLPSDVTGMNVFDRSTGGFRRLQGPVVTNLLLADELNRAIPRTQSALLEAMEEKQVTIDGETERLPAPFVVLATQNPVESESTFRLPAAQMDRFLMCLSMGYPTPEEEIEMLRLVGGDIPFDSVETVTGPEEICEIQRSVQSVTVNDAVTAYIVALTDRTRRSPDLRLGASPRASRALYRTAKALAAVSGREFVTPDDIRELAVPVLCHRLVLSADAAMAGRTAVDILSAILEELHCPFVINQNRYSIFDRTIEHNGLLEAARAEGKGLITFSPLAQGLLTDRYLNGVPADSRIRTDGRFLKDDALTEGRLAQIRQLNEIAKERGQSLAGMALAWILRDDAVTSVLVGASKASQLLDNIRCTAKLSFTKDELDAIDRASL